MNWLIRSICRKIPTSMMPIRHRAGGFRRDEDGALIIFGLFIFSLMVLVGGMAVDFMRFETQRTKLQATLDRAILAAADLDQTLSPQAVVADYFDKAGLSEYLVNVNVDEGLNYRVVSATAKADVNMMFLQMAGINSLSAPAVGTAEERVSNVEISLILDISGSMGRNNKIANLRKAAKDFVDTVIRTDSPDLISLSLIPYTAQVNAGPDIFNQLNVAVKHNYSQCIDFDQSDFDSTSLDFTKTYTQMQNFEWSASYASPITNPGCPKRTYERIVPLSQNVAALKSTIDNYRARANTAIHIGMKWGVALLDPTSQPMVQNLVNQGKIDAAFASRPAAWDDNEAIKFAVLMTDGQNVNTYRIQDWAYNSYSEYRHWNRYALWRYLYNNVSYYNRSRYYYMKYSASQADAMLNNICTAAKAKGITVFSIGFEVTNYSADVMRNCASSPSHFFRVEGVEIGAAFNAIARQINQLRLIQ